MTAPLPPAPTPPPSYGYVSPIPVRRAHLGDALASEWTKIRSVRSTVWTLGTMVVLMLLIGLGVAAIASGQGGNMGEESALPLGFFGMLPASICVITLGVLTISSEYGTGMIRTTLTACPSRSRVLTAKAVVFFLLVFTVTLIVSFAVATAQVAMVEAAEPTAAEWARATVGTALFLAVLGLLSMAIGALVRHSAGAITVMIGLLLLPLVAALFMFAPALKGLQEALFTYSLPSQMIALYSDRPPFTESGPAGWEALFILVGVAVVGVGGAYALLNNRDV
ncbi:ABC transporter permease [Streptomyces termitum]|uniref:ABC transporter n=1 Tax=Streptomyces termitum TaxID=67368 RepID=A0A918SVX8_9ACTN|nr:ABC transporter permease [Streptomyces termitum]GHA74035.1 ABC transporter [Streptomyces termitum]